jgi:hypothetical protein
VRPKTAPCDYGIFILVILSLPHRLSIPPSGSPPPCPPPPPTPNRTHPSHLNCGSGHMTRCVAQPCSRFGLLKFFKVTIPASQNGVLAVLRGLQKWCFGAPMPASVARDVDVVSRSPCFRDSNKNVRFTCVEHVKGATSSPCCQHTLWIRGAFS